jgi:outer membrane protein assembly factor BamB
MEISKMKNFYISFVLVVVLTVSVLGADERVAIIEKSGIEHGVVVHVGPTDIGLVKAFAGRDNILFHGLTTDPVVLKEMRASITQAKATNRAHMMSVIGYKRLPYADNLINLLVIDLDSLVGEAPSQDEIMRVLVPQPLGVAAIKKGGKWKLYSKPRAKIMGTWEHHRKGPNGNMVTDDCGSAPNGVKWMAGPLYTKAGRKNSTQASLSSGGRNIYLTQNVGDNKLFPGLPYMLEARDAFNGLPIWQRLWKGPNRDVPKEKWPKREMAGDETARWSGSGQTSFAVVATPELIFIVEEGSLLALDAKTGKLVRTYSCTDTEQIMLCNDETLIAQTDAGISVFSINSEAPLWSKKLPRVNKKEVRNVRSTKMACSSDRIYFMDSTVEKLYCFSIKDGKELWDIPLARPVSEVIGFNFANDSVLGVAKENMLEVYSSVDGKLLWSQKNGHNPRDSNIQQSGNYLTSEGIWVRTGRYDWDIVESETGKLIRQFNMGMGFKNGCQGAILSGSHLVASRPAYFFDRKTGDLSSITFARGACGVGMIPANGLHYTSPHACACIKTFLRGVIALRSNNSLPGDDYPTVLSSSPKMSKVNGELESPWSTFGASSSRGCFSPSELPDKMRLLWKKKLTNNDDGVASREWNLRARGPLTQVVMDNERAYATVINAHELVALDPASGKLCWSFTAKGRISAPPTLYKGLCLLGDDSGFVYCLNSTDGSLRWSLNAARNQDLIMAYGQLVSPWPIEGGVLVSEGVAMFISGRAIGADGGVMRFGVDPFTGKEIWRKLVNPTFGIATYLTKGDAGVYAMGTIFKATDGSEVNQKDGLTNAVLPGTCGLNDNSFVNMRQARRKALPLRDFTSSELGRIRGSIIAAGKPGGKAQALFLRSAPQHGGNVAAKGAFKWGFGDKLSPEVNSLLMTNDKAVVTTLKKLKDGGTVDMYSISGGPKLWSLDLPVTPIAQGISAGFGRLYISCSDGTLHCYGE